MKRVIGLLLVFTITFGLISCTKETAPQKEEQSKLGEESKIELTDIKGRIVKLDKVPDRIVSLSPTNTEILFALGAGNKVVGVTSYCDYPSETKNIEKIGTFEGPNIELIKKVKPDIVLAGGYIQEDIIKALESLNIPVASTEALDFKGIFDSVRIIGKICGADEKAKEIVDSMQKDISAIAERTKGKEKLKVFYVVWTDPLSTAGAGTFINDIIKASGGINVAENVNGWANYSREQLIKDNPDILISAIHATDNGITKENLIKNPIFKELQCVKNGKVYIVSDDNIVSRSGPRVVQAIQEIARVLEENSKK